MTPYSIVFKKDERCNLGAVTLWQKKYGILKGRFIFTLCFLINFFAALLTFFSMYLEEDYNAFGTMIFVILEIILFTYIIVRTLRAKIIPEMAKNCDCRIRECSDKTQITLRENDIEIKTQYKKTNYFYDEIEHCFDKGTFAAIIVDRHTYPVVVPFISLEEGSKETFSAILKEKLQEKYERGV